MQIGWLQIVVIGLLVLLLFGKLPNIIQDLKSAYLELSKKDEEKNK
jgi:Sec-independent protein translocase protein TatA